ncbi:MAG: oligosaccharide flippase family protein [Clostridiaceae bacterium]
MKDGLFKKFISFSYGSWLGLIIGFLTTMVTTRILLPEDFGKSSMYTLAISVIMIFVTFGTDQSFIRFYYEEEEEKRGGLLYNTLKTPILFTILISVFIVIFRKSLSLFLFGEENSMAIFMLVIGIVAQLGDRYSRLVIRMKQRGNLYSILEVLLKVISFTALIGFYFLVGPSYEIIIYSTVVSLLVIFGLAVLSEKKYWNIRNASIEGLKHSSKEILRFGLPLMVTALVTWLFQSFDKLAIRQWSTLDEVGLYEAAAKIVALVHIFQITFSNFWTPVCYEHYENHPEDKDFYGRMMRVITVGMLAVAIMSIAGKDIIIAFLGKNYRNAANIMPFLVFMPVMHTISETTVIGINFKKKPRWHIFIAAVACLANIIGNALLVPKYGAVGAAISTAVGYVLFFTLRTLISSKYYKVDYSLGKFYLMITILFAYSFFSITTKSFWMNILAGGVVMGALLLIYIKETREAISFIRTFKFSKPSKSRKIG